MVPTPRMAFPSPTHRSSTCYLAQPQHARRSPGAAGEALSLTERQVGAF